jgi:hypothetical protein
MDHTKKSPASANEISSMLPTGYMDNILATTWKQLKLNSLIGKAGISKRSGTAIGTVVFLLLLWVWLKSTSIAFFCRESLHQFSRGKKDMMYDLLKREDVNWRTLNNLTAQAIYDHHKLGKKKYKTLVLDDSVKKRRGKKMEAVSSHFDHVSGSHVMGQQVLTLGLSTDDIFLPLDSQLVISKVKASEQIKPYKDGRSIMAKRHNEAHTSKPEIAKNMLKRALRQGMTADYLTADAWFGTKTMIRTALDLSLCPILRMKKNKMKYRVSMDGQAKLINANELYQQVARKQWQPVAGLPWKAVECEVELNIATENSQTPQWQQVKLLFVRGINEDDNEEAGKKQWALFLTTDTHLSKEELLEIYALRWRIEVYFKEAKQHLGFLKEQTITFASHTASIHLCAIRYLLLAHNKLIDLSQRISDIRTDIQNQLRTLHDGERLWPLFRSMIAGTLQNFKEKIGDTIQIIMATIDERVNNFFRQSLQLDVFTMTLEHQ